MDAKQRDKIMRESSLVDPSKAVLLESTIDAFPVLTYVWRCPACKEMNFSIPNPDAENACTCPRCKEKFTADLFDRELLSEIKTIMENPDAIMSGGTRNSHTVRNGISCKPLIRYIFQCPSCGTINPSIPVHDNGLVACSNFKCQMRYPYSAIKHDYNKQFDRLVSELKIPIYNY